MIKSNQLDCNSRFILVQGFLIPARLDEKGALCHNKAAVSLKDILKQNPEWPEIQDILKTLHKNGYEAAPAGGCVRDSLLQIVPKDFDIACSARPEEILRIFPNGNGRWKHYGVIFLPLKKTGRTAEITTFRRESSYKDGRRPQVVEYTSSIQEDALRRDFTVNALFYDLKRNAVLDFTQGLKDIKSRRLRTVGDPQARFTEDWLRPLRAVRFAHQLKFSIEPATSRAVSESAHKLKGVSRERIYSELLKMFGCARMDQAVRILRDHSFDMLFPFQKKTFKNADLFWKSPFSFYSDPAFVWAVFGAPFFYDSPDGLKDFLLSLKAPAGTARQSAAYVRASGAVFSENLSVAEKLQAVAVGPSQVSELSRSFGRSAGLPLKDAEDLFQKFQALADGKGRLPPPLIKGQDLLKSGLSPGKEMGKALKDAYKRQLEQNISSRREALKQFARLQAEKKDS